MDPIDWIDHLPGITSVGDLTFGELMVPVSAIRQHFAALPEPETTDDLARIMREADASMRDELGRNRSRTSSYWRDLASLVLAATSSRPAAPELRAALDPESIHPRCPWDATSVNECATARERDAAGLSNVIASCPRHGDYPQSTQEPEEICPVCIRALSSHEDGRHPVAVDWDSPAGAGDSVEADRG